MGCRPSVKEPSAPSTGNTVPDRVSKPLTEISRAEQHLVGDFNGDAVNDTARLWTVEEQRHFSIILGGNLGKFDFGKGNTFGILDHDLAWIDTIYLSNDSVLYSQVFLENGDVDIENYDSVLVRYPSISLLQEELGGGTVYWKDGKFNWVHQAD